MNQLTEEYVRFLTDWENDRNTIDAQTSGSTGKPKKILLLKDDMRRSAHATNVRFDITSDSIILSPLSCNYIAGKMMVVRALDAGCSLITEPPSSTPLKNLTFGDYIDLMCVVPSQVESLLHNPIAIRKLKNLIIGGGPLSAEIEVKLNSMPWKSFVTYGMTETCSHVALRQIGNDFYTAMPGITFSSDLRGCLIIHAPEFSFRKLITNDAVELIDQTTFRWLGRVDYVINSGGIKFHPEMLERVLSREIHMPFYIHSVTHPKWGEAVAITIEDSSDSVHTEDIIQICREKLPKYAIPYEVRIVPQLERTMSGKIIRKNVNTSI